jgi:hypothetical protein
MFSGLSGLFEQMEWAEDEITRAQRRHPEARDRLYHAFKVCTPTHELMATEFVYRAHVREQLDRVMAGQDTRPGTDVELICMLSDTSKLAPMNDSGAGLYGRLWIRRFPQHKVWDDIAPHHEALHSAQIDWAESEARRKLAVRDRQPDNKCAGMHHGEEVACEFAVREIPAGPVQLALIA